MSERDDLTEQAHHVPTIAPAPKPSELNPAVVEAALASVLFELGDSKQIPMVRISNARLRLKRLLSTVRQYTTEEPQK